MKFDTDGKQGILLNKFNIPRVYHYHSRVTRSETYYYLLQLSCHSVAVVVTLVQ